jgi:hypothetical protein
VELRVATEHFATWVSRYWDVWRPGGGDLNYDGEINAADALVAVRFVAGLPFPLPSGCPPLNS